MKQTTNLKKILLWGFALIVYIAAAIVWGMLWMWNVAQYLNNL